MKYHALLFLLTAALAEVAMAKVSMPALFSDSMVMQREQPLRLWGKASPGEEVTATFGGESGKTVAGPDGKWQLELPAQPASLEGGELRVRGSNQLIFKDVVIGDVWVCSGQSNMAFLLAKERHAAEELPQADLSGLRFFRVAPEISFSPQERVPGKSWVKSTPETAKNFSAVAYYFGKEILLEKNIPIGLIGSYWGGTPAEAWMSAEALEGNPIFKHYLGKRDRLVRDMETYMRRYNEKILPQWERDREQWEMDSQAGKAISPAPRKPTAPNRNPGTPTVLYNAMIHPLLNLPIKGVIWYQGEANGKAKEKSLEYGKLFPALIADWRSGWKQGDFPFLFVQLAGFGGGDFFPELRAAQASALTTRNTGMAVALDVGEKDTIHPTDKRTVGLRLALVARKVSYGEDILDGGPEAASVKRDGDAWRLSFSKTGGKLVCRGSELKGFEVAGEDGRFVAAPALLEGETVLLDCRGIPNPGQVRYGWAPYSEANLYNAAGLPTAPFVRSLNE